MRASTLERAVRSTPRMRSSRHGVRYDGDSERGPSIRCAGTNTNDASVCFLWPATRGPSAPALSKLHQSPTGLLGTRGLLCDTVSAYYEIGTLRILPRQWRSIP